MSGEITPEQMVTDVIATLKLTESEQRDALTLARYYTCAPEGYWPWGDDPSSLNDRQKRIDEAVVAAIANKLGLNGRWHRAGFDTARITTAQMRHSLSGGTARRPSKARGKPGRRG